MKLLVQYFHPKKVYVDKKKKKITYNCKINSFRSESKTNNKRKNDKTDANLFPLIAHL